MGTLIFGVVNQQFRSLRIGILSLLPLVNAAKAMGEGQQASKAAAAPGSGGLSQAPAIDNHLP